ncbi:MAG: protein-disulfide reductase DsbD family protein [Alphaproteobacteria bacterium]|nr:protein-disulfide reductase DsbD family protein [Alphaproteobacteria bacterium]
MEYTKILPYLSALVLLVFANSAMADGDMWHEAKESRVRLLVSMQDVGEEALFYQALLEMEFADDWHSYWRFPGDAGIPLSLTPLAESGIDAVSIKWPLPERYEAYGLTSFVYKEKAAFPIELKLASDFEDNTSYNRQIKAFYMVCKMVCVPQEFVLTIPKYSELSDKILARNQGKMRFAERRLPYDGEISTLGINLAVLSKDSLVVAARATHGFDLVDLFVDAGDTVLLIGKPEVELQDDDPRRAMLRIKAPDGVENLQELLQGQTVRLVMKKGSKGVVREFTF